MFAVISALFLPSLPMIFSKPLQLEIALCAPHPQGNPYLFLISSIALIEKERLGTSITRVSTRGFEMPAVSATGSSFSRVSILVLDVENPRE